MICIRPKDSIFPLACLSLLPILRSETDTRERAFFGIPARTGEEEDATNERNEERMKNEEMRSDATADADKSNGQRRNL